MRPVWSSRRARLRGSRSAVLVALVLLAGTLGVAALVYKVWQGQYRTVLASLIQERHHALSALAAQFDSRLQTHISQTMGYLFEDDSHLAPLRIAALKERFEDIEQVLRFDAAGGMVYCIPGPSTQPEAYRRWLGGRLSHAVDGRPTGDIATGGFPDAVDGRQVVFFYAPIPADLSLGGSGWIVMRYGLDKLFQRLWRPLADAFAAAQGGTIDLVQGRPLLEEHDLSLPAPAYLTGWLLHYRPDGVRLDAIARQQSLVLAALLLAIGALPVSALAAWWWYGRRRLELAETKADFIARVSHELKTPLALIRLHAETLALNRVQDAARRQTYLDTIVRESDRLTGTIEQVLNFSRSASPVFEPRLDERDLGASVETALHALRPRLLAEGRSLITRIAAGLPPVAHDTESLASILANLLDNAAKYSPFGTPIEVRLDRQEDSVLLEVADRGMGLRADEVARLIEPFARGSGEKIAASKGVGLGLALVVNVMVAHGGRFEITPREGGGALARAWFPPAAAAPPMSPA